MNYFRFLAVLLLVLPVSRVFATGLPIVDQEFPAWANIAYSLDYPGDYMAQTFTVRNSGILSNLGVRVGLGGYNDYDPPVDHLLMRLVRSDNMGVPDISQVLASRVYQWFEIPKYSGLNVKYVEFDLVPWNISVKKGEVLAITLSSNQAYYDSTGKQSPYDNYYYSWNTALGDIHPGGDFFLYSPPKFGTAPHKLIDRRRNPDGSFSPLGPRDMGFRVLITVPELSSFAALSLLAGATISFGRIRRVPAIILRTLT